MAEGLLQGTTDKASSFQLGLFANAWSGARNLMVHSGNAVLPERAGLAQNGESPFRASRCWDAADPSGARLQEAVASQLASLQVQPWDEQNFTNARKIQDARRSNGTVFSMFDNQAGCSRAVKEVAWPAPAATVGMSATQEETMFGLACSSYLETQNYPYNCPIRGVFDDERAGVRRVVMDLAEKGDLFFLCSRLPSPGPVREACVLPLVLQALDSVHRLHDLGFVHGDISMENFLVGDDGKLRLIDFGRAVCGRWISPDRHASSKPSYRAPEEFAGVPFDGQAADTFALGVLIYALLVNDYPWLSTKPHGCKWFDLFQEKGFRSFAARRKIRGQGAVANVLSESALQLLEGLLQIDPSQRLKLERLPAPEQGAAEAKAEAGEGEANSNSEAQQPEHGVLSVWDSVWLQSQAQEETDSAPGAASAERVPDRLSNQQQASAEEEGQGFRPIRSLDSASSASDSEESKTSKESTDSQLESHSQSQRRSQSATEGGATAMTMQAVPSTQRRWQRKSLGLAQEEASGSFLAASL